MNKLNIAITTIILGASLVACSSNSMGSKPTNVVTMSVEPQLIDCIGVGMQKCMMVNNEFFYSQIEGFNYQEGYKYELLVKKTNLPLDKLPADVSSIRYQLIKELSKTKVAITPALPLVR